MKLIRFRVRNFRSVDDSGPIDVCRITSLVGRNESGKTNLLLALCSLNPPDGLQPLSPIKDFPRHRRLEECSDETEVLETLWQLDAGEQGELAEIFPRAIGVTEVTVGRRYGAAKWIRFEGLTRIEFDPKEIERSMRKIKPAVVAAGRGLDETHRQALERTVEELQRVGVAAQPPAKRAVAVAGALAGLRQALANAGFSIANDAEKLVEELEDKTAAISKDPDAHSQARQWIATRVPVFIYLDEYPELSGSQNIAEYLQRKEKDEEHLNDYDRNFEKLCKVAGLIPKQLQDLLAQAQNETRNQLANRAGSVITGEIRRLWKDRELTVRFHLDANYMNTLVYDPTAPYPVEVNLDERSRGFKWFFSFYVTFAADTKGGAAESAILLLDEPGLYLHAMSQRDSLRHFRKDFSNQIIYTTHSPFMVQTDDLDTVRTVSISQEAGTTVTNDPSGDAHTLFPLQSALGYNLAQSLFIGPSNLVVEGVTDYWILSAVSAHLADQGRTALDPSLTVTPAGGAQKVSYMVALLVSEELNVLVLLDQEKMSEGTKNDLVKSKLVREKNVVFVTEAFEGGHVEEADIEDVLDPDVYDQLVKESYVKELGQRTLQLNPKIPRMAKRYEAALGDLGIAFYKTRPARVMLAKMSSKAEDVITPSTMERFERLFAIINSRLKDHVGRNAKPFR